MKICKIEECERPVWSGGFCKSHAPKTSLRKKAFSLKTKKKATDNIEKEKKEAEMNLMKEFFISIWKKRIHRSELSSISLPQEMKSIYLHHILPKNKYKEAMYDEENIILLTFEEHQQVESNMYRYPLINERRIVLLKKYGYINI